MDDILIKKILFGFNLICLAAAIAMTSYWVYIFALDDDLCTIEFQKFYDKSEDSYPALSICFRNSISSEKIMQYNKSIDASSYLKFLRGEVFDPNMLTIKYSTIIQNITEYIEHDFV